MKVQTTLFCSLAAAALAMVSVAGAQTILLEDDFESYSAAAELGTSGPWNTPAGTWALSTDQAVSGTQSLYEAAGDSTTQVTAGITAVEQATLSPTNALIATYHVFPTSGGTIHRSGLNVASYQTGGWGGGDLEELLAWGFFS